MYHYVREKSRSDIPLNSLDVNVFEDQVKRFVRHYEIISAEDLVNNNFGRNSKEKLILTFDDGYLDHYKYVLPVLVKYKIKGTFYIPTQILEQDNLLDINKIHFLLATVNIDDILSELFQLLDKYRVDYKLDSNNQFLQKYAVPTRWDDRKTAFVKRMLQSGLPNLVRMKVLNNLYQELVANRVRIPPRLYLSRREIIEMSSIGMSVGAHTHNHLRLDTCSYKEQWFQISQSIEILKGIGIPSPQLSFCYPFGAFNKDTISILRKLNVGVAFTVNPKASVVLSSKNKFRFPRMDCNDFLSCL
jgi:peptidoglycan/xylan/chitin deacetylase (PgdA/CDA1 family)